MYKHNKINKKNLNSEITMSSDLNSLNSFDDLDEDDNDLTEIINSSSLTFDEDILDDKSHGLNQNDYEDEEDCEEDYEDI